MREREIGRQKEREGGWESFVILSTYQPHFMGKGAEPAKQEIDYFLSQDVQKFLSSLFSTKMSNLEIRRSLRLALFCPRNVHSVRVIY